MTNLQVVKALDGQINASFKRSAADPTEQQMRADLRNLQQLFRDAHNARVANARVVSATKDLMRVLSPTDAREIARIMGSYGR